ncbi:hypothetical protein BCR33DRAFT_724072 [Rhizoclosmatium globosum]|uniref:BZIP domain-containing protein n=1 Tax=Rhizoclosmatium globosum TaxID=329046 RepID=A0A1Y2B8G2_9FUNG|nr:hypothetical protein BCR33DRAFT_724072 [Rhizoclosmatium globosum]|eukprot:ORY31122.1 hypothetical protein BCR33DRAFT_724072 [Rhizoclosmatium globosum]
MDPDLAREYLVLKDPSLTSKERRQLRNKLSARSFRERRKELSLFFTSLIEFICLLSTLTGTLILLKLNFVVL